MVAVITKKSPVSIGAAQSILARGTDCHGPAPLEEMLGAKIPDNVSTELPLSFTEERINRAKENGECLRFLSSHIGPAGIPVTAKLIHDRLKNTQPKNGSKFLCSVDWYKDESFFTTETVRTGWAFVRKELAPGSTGKNYLAQSKWLAEYVSSTLWTPDTLPKKAKKAVAELTREEENIAKLMNSEWQKASEALAALAINRFFRENLAELHARLALNLFVNGERSLESTWAWLGGALASDRRLVGSGDLGGVGAGVDGRDPGYFSDVSLGVCPLCSGEWEVEK